MLPHQGELDQKLRDIYPEKAVAVGQVTLQALITDAGRRAQQYGFSSVEASQMIVGLMFALGSSFDVDPKLPWAKDSLKRRPVMNEKDALMLLYQKAADFLKICSDDGGAHA